MRGAAENPRGELRRLLRLDARRARSTLRHPQAGALLGLLAPLILLGGLLWSAGPRARPEVGDAGGAQLLGFLIAGPLAYASYTVLFRAGDDPFLRRLGIGAEARLGRAALRLFALAAALVLGVLLPFASGGEGLDRPLAVALAAAVSAWGVALLAFGAAADSVAHNRRGILSRLVGPDRELAAAAPLVYAPLAPLIAGVAAAGWTGAAPGAAWGRALVCIAVGFATAGLARRPFARALPRFAPRALEMAFAPPPAAGETGLAIGRGVARFLPPRARAVWARDAAVVGRRFRWSTRLVWPVALAGVVGLARWGEQATVRGWIVAAGGLVLLVQAAAVIALGRVERGGPRWLDRSVGAGREARWLGRWLLGVGLSLWLTVPLWIAWSAWGAGFAGWSWLTAGVVSAALASLLSLAAAGR